jgi:hypothetical protein
MRTDSSIIIIIIKIIHNPLLFNQVYVVLLLKINIFNIVLEKINYNEYFDYLLLNIEVILNIVENNRRNGTFTI